MESNANSTLQSSLKHKNIKYSSFCNNIINKSLIVHGTLDSKHQDKIKEFEKKEKNLNKCKGKLNKLKQQYDDITEYTIDNISKRAQLKESIRDLERDIAKMESCEDELEYFDNTLDIIEQYYNNDTDTKSDLFDNYLKVTQKIHLNTKKINSMPLCEFCRVEKTLHLQEGMLVCTHCGHSEFIAVESDKPNYKEPIIESKPNGYKRMNHFSELLNQFQGKESTEIPNEIFQQIINELKKLRITDLSTLNNDTLRAILKKLDLNSYYEHIPYIINKLNGLPPPTLTRELEDKLRQLFKEVQEPFKMFKPPNRKNFINNNYVFHKLFELLGYDEFLPYFSYLKSREKLQEHDELWKKICEYNRWEYHSSL
jgi:polyhydroxyalkanoate synthesis regulator phasin